MISILVCSKNKLLLNSLMQNIKNTVGIEYEILYFDNTIASKGICSVYNHLASIAKYKYLLFLHEDVKFVTQNWGSLLIKSFSIPDVGMVGLSGSIFKSKFPATWSSCHPDLYRISAIQSDLNTTSKINVSYNPCHEEYSEVAIIDGFFMCVEKSTWVSTKFDSENLHGFHCYDIDFSLSVGTKLKIIVNHKILCEHFSIGSPNCDWLLDSIKIHDKWKKKLPKKIGRIDNCYVNISNYSANECVYNVAYKCSNYRKLIFKIYVRFVFSYFFINHFKYTKKTIKYFINYMF